MMKISTATLPYLEQLHKLLLDPPYVNIILYYMQYFLNKYILIYFILYKYLLYIIYY